jgi:UDP-2,4-diacetamido-2,4,6-trideoxy-beta-L-altropyranose hydrolase
MVRRDLLAKRPAALKRRGGPVQNILVSFGATDSANVTPRVLDALADFADGMSIVVALSARAPHIDEVRSKLRGRMKLVIDGEMAELMTKADLAIGAAGSSAFERAALGLPSIIVAVTDNQRGIARLLVNAVAAVDGGIADAGLSDRLRSKLQELFVDAEARLNLSKAAASLVDGRGRQRLLISLAGEALASGSRIRLRLAEFDDESWLFDLQREPLTRRYFRNSESPSMQDHAAWMRTTLGKFDTIFSLIEMDGERAGYLRLDRVGARDRVEISIAVHPDFVQRGTASAALMLARRMLPGVIFEAEVSPKNIASQALFERAGFRQITENRYRQQRFP